MALIWEDGEWRISCVEYRVDDDGRPIAGSDVYTTMKASKAAAAMVAYTGGSLGGLKSKIEKQRLLNSQRVAVDFTPSYMQIWRGTIS